MSQIWVLWYADHPLYRPSAWHYVLSTYGIYSKKNNALMCATNIAHKKLLSDRKTSREKMPLAEQEEVDHALLQFNNALDSVGSASFKVNDDETLYFKLKRFPAGADIAATVGPHFRADVANSIC